MIDHDDPRTPLEQLRDEFPDPRDCYVASPRALTARELALLYHGREGAHDQLAELRRRMHDERWLEARAVHQARRSQARLDSIVHAEAAVWASLGLDYHAQRVRSLWERWQTIDELVRVRLHQVLDDERAYASDLRDMLAELRQIEEVLDSMMPKLGVEEHAQRMLRGAAEGREEMVRQIGAKLGSIAKLAIVGG